MVTPTTVQALEAAGQALLFSEAQTANAFRPDPVDDAQLRAIWELAKWPPTATNANPGRILFVRTPEGKERLLRHMSEGNREKTAIAPVTAVLAADLDFHEHLGTLMAAKPQLRERFASDDAFREGAARFNATLQAGYFILAVRAAGLAAGPMGGFDQEGVDAEFLAGTTWRSLLTVNVGHPAPDAFRDRNPRPTFEQAVRLV